MSGGFVIGLDHHKAPLELRERVAAVSDDMLLDTIPPHVSAMVLSTCNRYEVYTAPSENWCASMVPYLLSERSGIPVDELRPALYQRHGKDAIRHGFAVAASLESMVVGEPQILGQMKTAFLKSRTAGRTDSYLSRYLESALRVGKRVRHETELGKGKLSVASVGVDVAKDIFGDLKNCSVLLVGAGDMCEAAALHAKNKKAGKIRVVNRTLSKAQVLAEKVSGEAYALESLEDMLAKSDVVITSTSSEVPLMTKAMMSRVLKARKYKPMLLVDLAVPRDVTADVEELDGVYVYDMDALASVVKASEKKRADIMKDAWQIVDDETSSFVTWSESRQKVHMMSHLRGHVEEVRREVLTKLGGTPEAEEATRLFMNTLLHKPSKAAQSAQVETTDIEKIIEFMTGDKCPRQKEL
ncbi:MAG: glutamyl-tRNA reductase [Alphaproteobacteria bacterium]|nr:glutamyl-tRNA reductase [Alphaproteobacteria bacterium]